MGFPIETCPVALLPLLIKARSELHALAAPQASDIAARIGAALEALIEVAGDVEAYGHKWGGGGVGEMAAQNLEATREWYE